MYGVYYQRKLIYVAESLQEAEYSIVFNGFNRSLVTVVKLPPNYEDEDFI